MEKRKEGNQFLVARLRGSSSWSRFYFLFSIFCFLFLTSCGAPGEPQPPQAAIPAEVTDLGARQTGDSVVLTFTLPKRTVEGEPLEEPPEVEIFRAFVPAGTQAARATLAQVYTIPSAVVDTYLSEDRMRFADPLKAADIAAHSGEQMAYMVRTRASKRAASADSKRALVRVYAVPEAIRDLTARVTEPAVELRWTPPEQTTSGAPIAALAGYRVYRAEAEPNAEESDAAKWQRKRPAELLGVSPTAAYRDAQIEFGRTYLYTVRSVAQYELDSAESADSPPLALTLKDTFPPAAPKNLVAVYVPAAGERPAHIELSWSISPEADAAGYHVYRSEQEGTAGTRLTRELLPTPTFRDMPVAAGRGYIYTVTVVDRAGNESPWSAPVSAVAPNSGPTEEASDDSQAGARLAVVPVGEELHAARGCADGPVSHRGHGDLHPGGDATVVPGTVCGYPELDGTGGVRVIHADPDGVLPEVAGADVRVGDVRVGDPVRELRADGIVLHPPVRAAGQDAVPFVYSGRAGVRSGGGVELGGGDGGVAAGTSHRVAPAAAVSKIE